MIAPWLLLHWTGLGGEMSLTYDGYRDIWTARFEDGVELRATGRDIRWIGQEVRAYFRHERFLRRLSPTAVDG